VGRLDSSHEVLYSGLQPLRAVRRERDPTSQAHRAEAHKEVPEEMEIPDEDIMLTFNNVRSDESAIVLMVRELLPSARDAKHDVCPRQ
jgi:hypothetical protein